jgi:hypothetical protein
MADETINVGDRVRLKGDVARKPLWLTVLRKDDVPASQNGAGGTFISVGYVATQDGGSLILGHAPGIMVSAVTKEPPAEPTKRSTP